VASESTVSFRSCRYSVPPAYVGRTVEVSCEGAKLVVRSGDLIVAEHEAAARPGSCVMDKQHLDELWKLAAQRTPQPLPSWRLTFDQSVAATPLNHYERFACGQGTSAAQGRGVMP
jgi:hypothetical protein